MSTSHIDERIWLSVPKFVNGKDICDPHDPYNLCTSSNTGGRITLVFDYYASINKDR